MIAFCIVTYNRVFYNTESYTTLVKSLQKAGDYTDRIYVYDNSDESGWKIALERNTEHLRWYFHNASNPGLAIAYNTVAKKAFADGFNWLVLLDDDTSVPTDAYLKYTSAAIAYPHIQMKVPVLRVEDRIFSPCKFFLQRSVMVKDLKAGIYRLGGYRFVNSGLMIDYSLYIAVGGYDESLKLDFLDFQFIEQCKRFTSHFEVLSFECKHLFSDGETNREKALIRYRLFIKDLKKCKRYNWKDFVGFYLVDYLHLLKLTIRFKTMEFFKERLKSNSKAV
ncbi:MAG TPA: glycosyltransferase [Flavipsychrobacter sp.]|nr:glycosyltransferase [Flavipsychrobacter sp.]